MKVKELKAILDKFDDDMNVIVCARTECAGGVFANIEDECDIYADYITLPEITVCNGGWGTVYTNREYVVISCDEVL